MFASYMLVRVKSKRIQLT